MNVKIKKFEPEKNKFFDINKLPGEEGILLFPFSMSKLLNAHSPKNIIHELHYFSDKKISAPKVGANFIYCDFLYLFSQEKSKVLKKKFTEMVWQHSNGLKDLITKNKKSFQIQHAFSFMTWSQLYILSKDFIPLVDKLKTIYAKDFLFQKYVKEDARLFGRRVDENQVNFFLEESLLLYLILKGKIKLPNEYIQGREQWVLFCYPGNPPKTLIYLFQKNFFKLPQIQPYEGQYNSETRKFIDFHNVDLDTYSVK
jgi:hypothetical protein